MGEDNERGAAYLARLRQSITSAAAPGPAKEIAANEAQRLSAPQQSTATPFEKRKSPRYRCNGSARLQEVGSATSTWATFTDISMHGCYLETAVPCNVGTLLDLKLDAEGIHLDTQGEVRVAYPGVGMGISFTKISDPDRTCLRKLLVSLSPRSSLLETPIASTRSNDAVLGPESEVSSVQNAATTLHAIEKFFESRHMMARDEFLRILRNHR